MPTQLNQNTTDLQSILDAVNALPEATTVSGEIAITANGTYDVTKYASANVNVQSAPVLLWTNASPTSDFVAQTIGVNGAGYDAYIIEFYPNGQGSFPNGGTVVYIEKGRTDQIMIGNADSNFQWNRSITSVTDTGIAFSKASGSRCYQYHCVPVRIWGVKFTL